RLVISSPSSVMVTTASLVFESSSISESLLMVILGCASSRLFTKLITRGRFEGSAQENIINLHLFEEKSLQRTGIDGVTNESFQQTGFPFSFGSHQQNFWHMPCFFCVQSG